MARRFVGVLPGGPRRVRRLGSIPAVVVLGPAWIVAVVLGAAGVGKLLRPGAAVDALRVLYLPHSAPAVRLLGAVEAAVALAAVVLGGWAWAVVAAVYLALAGAAERLRRSAAGAAAAGGGNGAVAGCGCFGRSSAPVGLTHVAVDVVAAVVAAVAAGSGVGPLRSVWPELPAAGVAHLLLVGAGALAVVALLTVLPETRLAARQAPAPDPRIHLFGPTIGRRPSGSPAATPGSRVP